MNKPSMPHLPRVRMPSFKREYWYVAFTHQGTVWVWRLDAHNQVEADQKAMQKLGGRLFKAFKLNTKDMGEANAYGRALLLEANAEPDAVLHRAKHTEMTGEEQPKRKSEL